MRSKASRVKTLDRRTWRDVSCVVSGKMVGSRLTGVSHAKSSPVHEKVLDAIERVTISKEKIEIRLSDVVAMGGQDRTLTLPWIPPSPYQRREIIQGEGEPRSPIRPMRVRARAVFAESLRNAHRWLDELIRDPHQTIEVIAAREHKSERSIRMTLSLAFVAPPIVAAAIEGRLPRGFGFRRLMDLPIVGPTNGLRSASKFRHRPDPQASGHGHYQIAISECRLRSSAALRREHPSIWETEFCHQRVTCVWSPERVQMR